MLNRKTLGAVVMTCGLAAGASAQAASPPPPPAARACLYRGDIDGFSTPNDHTVYLSVRMKEVWRLDLARDCIGLGFRQGIGLEDRPASPWICSPLEATVVYMDHGMPERCPVTALRRLTPDEVKALPKKDRP